MKIQRQVQKARANGSGVARKTQQEKAAPAAAIPAAPAATESEQASKTFPMEFLKAASVMRLMVIQEAERRENSKEDCTRLRIIQSANDTLLDLGTGLLCGGPDSGGHASDRFKPFGPLEPTHEVEMARYHIADVWKQVQTAKAIDAMGGILCSLHDCIQHHPGLRAERAALSAINAGDNELFGFINNGSNGRWDGRKLSGPELWFSRKLKAAHDGPFAGFLALLSDEGTMFERDTRTAKVGEAIRKIRGGWDTFCQMRRWLDSL